ncbi:MAG: M15 family metallopeptidase [Weeksellaceae bacterium]|nr:M15 family metallopeptidase [Weeksellaceae bacterium]
MTRNQFLKTTMLGIAGLATTPLWAKEFSNSSLAEELIGRGNPQLVGQGYQLRPAVHEAFQKMRAAAKKQGFDPHIVSSYRSFAHQKGIWNRKYNDFTGNKKMNGDAAVKKIIEYSTMPGTSRHHWGTDFDWVDAKAGIIKNPLNARNYHDKGTYAPLKQWMNENAESFGFYEVYTNNPQRTGFSYEPWHFSYRPLACEYIQEVKKIDLDTIIRNTDLAGKQHVTDKFIEHYLQNHILGINAALLP